MAYVYKDAMSLEKLEKVGDGECVALVRKLTGAPVAVNWREGKKVIGDRTLHLGTAIATFVNGKWPGKSKGNHAAFYLSQTSDGMRIMDQWNSAQKPRISSRFIPRRGKNKDGSFVQPSDNADAFSVIDYYEQALQIYPVRHNPELLYIRAIGLAGSSAHRVSGRLAGQRYPRRCGAGRLDTVLEGPVQA